MAKRHPKYALTPSQVREALDYNPETGEFRWRHRAGRDARWNCRFAGKRAGSFSGPRGGAYVLIQIDGQKFYGHRLAWVHYYGEWPTQHLDHRDNDGRNNRIGNLRECTRSQNQCNRGLHSNNTTGHKGIWRRPSGYVARIWVNGVRHTLGTFPTLEEAVAVREAAAKRAYGAYARDR